MISYRVLIPIACLFLSCALLRPDTHETAQSTAAAVVETHAAEHVEQTAAPVREVSRTVIHRAKPGGVVETVTRTTERDSGGVVTTEQIDSSADEHTTSTSATTSTVKANRFFSTVAVAVVIALAVVAMFALWLVSHFAPASLVGRILARL